MDKPARVAIGGVAGFAGAAWRGGHARPLREDPLSIGQRAARRLRIAFDAMQEAHDGAEPDWRAFTAATEAVRRFNEYAAAAGESTLCPICWIESGERNELIRVDQGSRGQVECQCCGYGRATDG